MEQHGIPAGRIYTAREMLEDPHFAAREAIIRVEHPRFGALPMQAPFPKLSATPSSVRSRAPERAGQHNQEVYGALGLDAAELERLAAAGII
jgi:formyl-CoA transferase